MALPKVSDAQQLANAARSFINIVTAWGIPASPEVQSFARQAVMKGWNSSMFLQEVRKTKFYALHFPGIRRQDGSQRMSESEYLSGFRSAKDYASTVGRNFSKQMYGLALKKGNSPSEIKRKVEALDVLKEHRREMTSFNEYLVATGATKKPLGKKELGAFVMGVGPKEFEDAWTTSFAAAAIERTGFMDIGKPAAGGELGYRGLEKLIKKAPPGLDIEGMDWGDLASVASQALPASRLYKMGITKKDLLKMQLKIPGSEKTAARVKLAIATAQAAASEQRANPQLNREGLYTGKDRGLQATE